MKKKPNIKVRKHVPQPKAPLKRVSGKEFDSKVEGWEMDMLPHPFQFGFMLRLFRKVGDKWELACLKVSTVSAASLKGPIAGEVVRENSTDLSREQAQQLMDCLWNLKIRPSVGVHNSGELGATKAHLNDMRKLVAREYDVDLNPVIRVG